MDVFWIPHLTMLVFVLQTTSASDTTEVIGAVGGSVTFRSHNPDRNVALWSFGSDPIVTVVFKSPPRLIFFEDKFKPRFAVCEDGHALSIPRLRMEDAGTYSVAIGDKRSTFTLQVFRKLAEPTVTCEAQNCSGGSCSSSLRCSTPGTGFGNVFYTWRMGNQTWGGSSVVLQGNETSQDGLEPLTCTARNAVSSRNVTVTNLGELCAAIATLPPSTGAHSGSWIRIGVVAGVEIASLLSIFLVSYCKYKWECERPKPWGAGSGTWERDRAREERRLAFLWEDKRGTAVPLTPCRPHGPGTRSPGFGRPTAPGWSVLQRLPRFQPRSRSRPYEQRHPPQRHITPAKEQRTALAAISGQLRQGRAPALFSNLPFRPSNMAQRRRCQICVRRCCVFAVSAALPRTSVSAAELFVVWTSYGEQHKRQDHQGGSGRREALKNHPGALPPCCGAHFWVLAPQILSVSGHPWTCFGSLISPSSCSSSTKPGRKSLSPQLAGGFQPKTKGTDETSSVRGEPIMAAPARASNITVVSGALGGSVTFHINTTDEDPALWSYGDKFIVTAPFKDPSIAVFHNDTYKLYWSVSEKGRALTVAPLRMENAGNYSGRINGRAYNFTLYVFRKLAEPTVTCEAQNGSDGSRHLCLQCSLSGTDFVNGTGFGSVSYRWRAGDQLLAEGPMLLVNKSLLDMREPLTCTARNAVSSRNVTVTNLGELCAAIATLPPSTGANSGSWIWILIGIVLVIVVVVLSLVCLVVCCKYKLPRMRRRCWSSVGSQDDSHGAAGDVDTQAESPV